MERVSAFFYGDAAATKSWAAWCLEYNLDVLGPSIECVWHELCGACDQYLEWCLMHGMIETSVKADPMVFSLLNHCQKELYETKELGFNVQLNGYILLDPREPELIAIQNNQWNH